MGRIARRVSLVSPYPALSALPNPREDHPRATPHPSLGRSRSCADQTNFARLSPGVGCCFRALHSLARSLYPSYDLVSLFPYHRSILPRVLSSFSLPFPALSLFLSHSLFGLRSSTRFCCQQVSRESHLLDVTYAP